MISMTHKNPSFLFTLDIDWIPGTHTGVIDFYDFCEKYKLNPTLFITGKFALEYPDVIKEGAVKGYELGTHGWEHGVNADENFKYQPIDLQRKWIELSTEAVEKVSGVRPVAFRAPNLWIRENTLELLETLNYNFDSSIPSHRFDLGYGQVNNPKYYFAPLKPYYPSHKKISLEGNSKILEIAPSAYFIPFNMSALRLFGIKALKWTVRRVLEQSQTLVFYSHPSEFVKAENMYVPPGQPLRHKEGVGPENFEILGELVEYILSLGYESRNFRDFK
jgi:peptidoglycan-N-acetylglucosamine deacetylase